MTTYRVIGPGRAGRSLVAALDAVAGHRLAGVLGRGDDLTGAAHGVDVLVLAVPDGAVADVAAAVAPVASTAVLHLSGSLTLAVLEGHPRRGSCHPLVPLPTPEVGAARLRSGITFAVAGDPAAAALAGALGGRPREVADDARTAYHAAASVAANHLVALLGQVERLAAAAGLPLEAFATLIRAATDDALALGPHAALTGPARRGDWATLDGHRRVVEGLPGGARELAAYDALVALARRLAMDADGVRARTDADGVRAGTDADGARAGTDADGVRAGTDADATTDPAPGRRVGAVA